MRDDLIWRRYEKNPVYTDYFTVSKYFMVNLTAKEEKGFSSKLSANKKISVFLEHGDFSFHYPCFVLIF